MLIVGIAGGTGSGKTTLARTLVASLPLGSVAMLQHDAYYRDRWDLDDAGRDALNFDHPESLETSLLVDHLRALKDGCAIDAPIYDFKTHRRRTESTRVAPCPVVVVEGILILVEPKLREVLDLKVFVDADADVRIVRRLHRDVHERGRTIESVRNQYLATVRPMHLEFVESSRRFADLVVPGEGESDVAVGVLRSHLRAAIASN